MSKAKNPSTPIRSRRAVLVGIGGVVAAALPVAAPAMNALDPNGKAPPIAPAAPHRDTELLILVERCIAAEAEFDRLNRIWDEMPESTGKPPANLRIREG